MIRAPSLRKRITEISIGAFILTAGMSIAVTFFYSQTRGTRTNHIIAKELSQNVRQQIEQVLPVFLLPEQKKGLGPILERFKSAEDLSDIQLVDADGSALPEPYSKCKVNGASASVCELPNSTVFVGIYPVNESGNIFGYLIKAKAQNLIWSSGEVFALISVFILVMAITFALTYFFVVRIFSKKIPASLDQLVRWIEADLEGQKTEVVSLPYKELEDLKEKISLVMDEHSKAREQAVVGQLISGVMHDIRTPLQSVVTAMHLLDRESSESPKRLSRLENLALMCRDNIPAIGDIIETTLDGGREIYVSRTNLDLLSTIDAALNLCEDLKHSHHVTVEHRHSGSLVAMHDSVQLGRVLHNLIKNAIEAAHKSNGSGVVRITSANIGNQISVRVEDNGAGLTGKPDRLFRAFQSSKLRGTGLGLFISKKIIEAHDGEISATQSLELGGACFEFQISSFVDKKRPVTAEALNETIA